MSTSEQHSADGTATTDEGVSLATLIVRLGRAAGTELFRRIDSDQRQSDRIVGSNARSLRVGLTRARTAGQAQFVTLGRANRPRTQSQLLSDSIVIMKLDDVLAVVKAGQKPFDWVTEFAPRAGLAAATVMPTIRVGSRGLRQVSA